MPAAATSSSDKVVAAILQGIRAGQLAPGQRLVEADLTGTLEVSRGPIREALNRLAAEGIVRITRHRGAYVNALSRAEARDTFVVIEVLTKLMARLAARAIALGAVGPAVQRLKDFRRGEETDLATTQGRADFYDALQNLGGNRQLERIRPSQQIQLLRRQMQPYLEREDLRDQLDEYARITNAVLAGDPAAAEAAMGEHVQKARRRLERTPDAAFRIDQD